MVIGWLMEHALKYDLVELRNQLKTLFPNLVSSNRFAFPNKPELTDLALMRSISRDKSDTLCSAESLKHLIDHFSKTYLNHEFCSKKPRYRMQLEDFLNKLKMMKNLLQLKNMMTNVQDEYKDLVSKDFESTEDSSANKKLKLHCEKQLKKKVDEKIDTTFIEADVDKIRKEVVNHAFIKSFESFALEHMLKHSTSLELFIKNKADYLPTDVSEVQILSNHVSKMEQRHLEKSLIQVAQEISGKRDPTWCPVIYIEDPVTKGLNGIKIANAYE